MREDLGLANNSFRVLEADYTGFTRTVFEVYFVVSVQGLWDLASSGGRLFLAALIPINPKPKP